MSPSMRILVFAAIVFTGVLATFYIADRIHPCEVTVLHRPIETELYSRRDDQLWYETYVRPLEIGREFWEMFPEDESPYSEEQAHKWATELIPLVEQATARSFVSFPTIKLVGREKLASVLTEELTTQLGNMIPAGEDVDTSRLAQQQAIVLAPMLLGMYGIHDQVLYLVPKNLRPIFEYLDAEQSLYEPIAKLVIAHELTHALQDQIVGLRVNIDNIASHTEMEAFMAAIEGHAVFVEDRVAEQLQFSEAAKKMATMLSSGAIEFDDPAFEIINQILMSQFEQIYLGGRDFMAYHAERGGADQLWHILAHPPKSFSQIFAPETYGTEVHETVNLRNTLRGLDRYFQRRHWPSYMEKMTESQLRADFALLDTGSRGEIMSRIRGAYKLVLQASAEGRLGSVSVFVLSDGCFAPTMIAMLEDMAIRSVQQMASGSIFDAANFTAMDLDGIEADAARIVSYEFGLSGSPLMAYQIVRAARGPILVEILDVGIGLSQQTFIELLDETFERVNKALNPIE